MKHILVTGGCGYTGTVLTNKLIDLGNKVTVKFKNVKVPYLNGLILRYSPLTQKKKFYLKYKYKGKSPSLSSVGERPGPPI